MNRLNTLALAGLFLMPLAGTLQAQQPRTGGRGYSETGRQGRPGRQFDMAGRLIAMRSDLKLTDAQVARLTSIQQKYRDRNAPVMERLRNSRPDSASRMRRPGFDRDSMRSMTPDQREAMRKQVGDQRAAYLKAHPEVGQAQKQLRDNMQAMRKDIDSVLTPDQRGQLKEHMQQGRGQWGGRGQRTKQG